MRMRMRMMFVAPGRGRSFIEASWYGKRGYYYFALLSEPRGNPIRSPLHRRALSKLMPRAVHFVDAASLPLMHEQALMVKAETFRSKRCYEVLPTCFLKHVLIPTQVDRASGT